MSDPDRPAIRVKDRRVSSKDGEARPAEGDEEPKQKLPEIDFVTFVLSLSTTAMVSLGAVPNPDTGEATPDLSLAKQTIDILGILQDKTRGNLTGEEERILDSVLYDLRMSYVQAAGRKA